MRIALVGPYHPATGGVQIYMTYLARELISMGHEVIAISYADAEPQAGEEVRRAPRVPVPGLRGVTFIAYSTYSLIKVKPDVALTHYALTSGQAGFLASLLGGRYTVTFHGSDLRISRRLSKLVASRASAVVAVSNWIAEKLRKMGIRADRVIPGGVDGSLFSSLPSREEIRREMGLEGKVVLSVGALTEAKGFDLIPDIAALVNRELEATFLIVGEGPLAPKIEKRASSLGVRDKVRLLGRRSFEETVKLYRAADLLLHPARHEGYGLVALESLAAGTPVVAADVEGLRDVVMDGVDGFLTPRSAEAMAKKVLILLRDENLREEMAKRGRERALKRTWNRVAQEYLELIEEVFRE